jgi:hypothetical protein
LSALGAARRFGLIDRRNGRARVPPHRHGLNGIERQQQQLIRLDVP